MATSDIALDGATVKLLRTKCGASPVVALGELAGAALLFP